MIIIGCVYKHRRFASRPFAARGHDSLCFASMFHFVTGSNVLKITADLTVVAATVVFSVSDFYVDGVRLTVSDGATLL